MPRLIRHALAEGLQVYVYSNLVYVTDELWELFSQPGVSLGTSWYAAEPGKHAGITGDQDTKQAAAMLRRLGVRDRVG